MMAKLLFERFRVLGVVFFFLGACATVQERDDPDQGVFKSVDEETYSGPPPSYDSKVAEEAEIKRDFSPWLEHDDDPVKARLSRISVPDASIITVSASFPDEWVFESVPYAWFQGRKVIFYDIDIQQEQALYEAVFGVPYLQKPGELKFEIRWKRRGEDSEGVLMLPFEVTSAKYGSEKLRVDPSKVRPPKKALPRIRREIREVKKVYGLMTLKKHWSGPFQLPVSSRVTSRFGTKRLYNGKMKSAHKGLDLKAAVGTPIRAPSPGFVAMAKDLYYTGNTVLLDHGYGVVTLYAHMSKLRVKKGDQVSTGQLLGLAGATGRVTGPHLHWGAIIQGVKVNPRELLSQMR